MYQNNHITIQRRDGVPDEHKSKNYYIEIGRRAIHSVLLTSTSWQKCHRSLQETVLGI